MKTLIMQLLAPHNADQTCVVALVDLTDELLKGLRDMLAAYSGLEAASCGCYVAYLSYYAPAAWRVQYLCMEDAEALLGDDVIRALENDGYHVADTSAVIDDAPADDDTPNLGHQSTLRFSDEGLSFTTYEKHADSPHWSWKMEYHHLGIGQ